MTYLALLRGINVGGKNKVEMARLKTLFESIGCGDVRTYINSGNVIFTSNRVAARLRTSIEKAIAKEFGFHVSCGAPGPRFAGLGGRVDPEVLEG